MKVGVFGWNGVAGRGEEVGWLGGVSVARAPSRGGKVSGSNPGRSGGRIFFSVQGEFSAISTFSPVGSLSSDGLRMRVCVCLCVAWNELIREYASVVYTLSSFRPHTHTHTHTHTHLSLIHI